MDYSKTIVYHFVCQNTNIKCSYVGSTTNFSKRKNKHKKDCHNEQGKSYNLKIYQAIRDNGGWDNWTMSPLEEYPCENSIQQRIREQHWIDTLNAELNMVRAYTNEEDAKKNKNQKSRIHYNDTIEYQIQRKADFYTENKEMIDNRNRLYYETNREKIAKQRKEKRDALKSQTQ